MELRESMKLLADEAGAGKPATVGARWPDFARFDCYACHHELDKVNEGSWRQARFRGGAPGRPLAPDWPMVLVQLGIAAGDSSSAPNRQDRLDQGLSKVRDSLKFRPFGDAPTLGPAARDVAGWADSAIHDLKDTVFDAAMARTLLERLCKLAADRIPDYDSARQIAWAFRVIYREAVPENRRDPEIDTRAGRPGVRTGPGPAARPEAGTDRDGPPGPAEEGRRIQSGLVPGAFRPDRRAARPRATARARAA